MRTTAAGMAGDEVADDAAEMGGDEASYGLPDQSIAQTWTRDEALHRLGQDEVS